VDVGVNRLKYRGGGVVMMINGTVGNSTELPWVIINMALQQLQCSTNSILVQRFVNLQPSHPGGRGSSTKPSQNTKKTGANTGDAEHETKGE